MLKDPATEDEVIDKEEIYHGTYYRSCLRSLYYSGKITLSTDKGLIDGQCNRTHSQQ